MNILDKLGSIAGIAGITTGVFLLIFREVIRKRIFPNLTKAQAYKIIRLILFLTWSLAVFGIAIWIYSKHAVEKNEEKRPKDDFDSLMLIKADTSKKDDKGADK